MIMIKYNKENLSLLVIILDQLRLMLMNVIIMFINLNIEKIII